MPKVSKPTKTFIKGVATLAGGFSLPSDAVAVLEAVETAQEINADMVKAYNATLKPYRKARLAATLEKQGITAEVVRDAFD